MVPWVDLQCVIVKFLGHIYLHFDTYAISDNSHSLVTFNFLKSLTFELVFKSFILSILSPKELVHNIPKLGNPMGIHSILQICLVDNARNFLN